MNKVLTNPKLQKDLIDGQNERLEDFRHEVIYEMFTKYLLDFIEGK